MPTTIIYSPHPDDETLRLTGYALTKRAEGNRMILVSLCNGDGTAAGPGLSLDAAGLRAIRLNEQAQAWRNLGGTAAQRIVCDLSDGAGDASVITAIARDLQAVYGPEGLVEHYAAAHKSDVHPDHQAVAAGLKAAGVPVVRYALPAEMPDSSAPNHTPYYVPAGYEVYAEAADHAYAVVGYASVGNVFNIWKAGPHPYRSRIVAT